MAQGSSHLFGGNTQEVEIVLYLCGELQQGTFNRTFARGGDCGKWTEGLSGHSFHKYAEARIRAYHVHHMR